jgi:hypothetical protein
VIVILKEVNLPYFLSGSLGIVRKRLNLAVWCGGAMGRILYDLNPA